MTDRELLEAAAKAAEIELGEWDSFMEAFWLKCDHPVIWNPLTDDGDALRLACKLSISIDHNRAGDQQRYVVAERPGCEGCFAPVCAVEDDIEDESHRASATRRAIVRAAAEIEKEPQP